MHSEALRTAIQPLWIAIAYCACAQAAPGLQVDVQESAIEGSFDDGRNVGIHAAKTGDDGAAVTLTINEKVLDISIDLATHVVTEDPHGNRFDADDRAVLLHMRDACLNEHPEWMDSLRGRLLIKTADRWAEMPLDRVLERREASFAPTQTSGFNTTSGCGGDGVTCFPGTSGSTYAIFSANGTCRAEPVQYGDSACRGRCGIGCNWFDNDYTWDCLDHDVCLDYSNDCSDEFNDAADDWAATVGPYCFGGSTRSKPPEIPSFKSLIGVDSGKCLDVRGASQDNSADIILWQCHGGPNQQWKLVPLGDGTVEVVVQHSGKCLDLAGGDRSNGARVQQWECVANDNQRWYVRPGASGSFALASKVSNKCIDVPGWSKDNGVNMQVWDCANTTNQSWHP